MDKKYKAIKTIKQLDLSKGARSSISSISGKSDFSTISQEDKFNSAYAKDFSVTPPKTQPSLPKTPPKILPTPSKKDSLRPRTAPAKKLLTIPDPVIEKRVKNPKTKQWITIEKYNKLREEGKFGNDAPINPPLIDVIRNPAVGGTRFITVYHYEKLKAEGKFDNIVEKPKKYTYKPKSPEPTFLTKAQLIEKMEEINKIKEGWKWQNAVEHITDSHPLFENGKYALNYNDIMSGFFEKVIAPMMMEDKAVIKKMIDDIKKDRNNIIKYYDIIYQKKRKYHGMDFKLSVPEQFLPLMEKRRIAEAQETEKQMSIYYKAQGALPNPFDKLKPFNNPYKKAANQNKN